MTVSETAVVNKHNIAVKECTNSMVQSVNDVLPMNSEIGKPALIKKPYYKRDLGVLIGLTGDLSGQVLIEGEHPSFSFIAQQMFGAAIEGEMLESFVGELGNMISGNMVTNISAREINLDISPPAVIVGESKFTAFDNAINIPVTITASETINIIMMIKQEVF